MASTGIHEYGNMKTWYSDAKLKEASGNNDALAYLDFYMAHYYPEYIGTSGSPFHHPASYWSMDRPILIGAFPAQSWGNGPSYGTIQSGTALPITAAYEYAYDNGYCGAMSWSMTEGDKNKFGSFTTTEPALKNLHNKHKADIDILDKVIEVPTGDQVMKVAISGLPSGSPQAELGKEGDLALSGKTSLIFDVYIAPGSATNMTILPVVKVGSDWVWSPATNYAVNLSTKPTGEWFTVTIPISNGFVPESGSFSASNVKAFLLQFQPSSAYTGTIYINNVRADNTVLYSFDDMGSEWSASKWVDNAAATVPEITVSQVSKSSVGGPSSIFNGGKTVAASTGRVPSVVVNGKILNVTGADNADMRIKMVDMRGKTVANFKSSGSGQFSLTNIPAGRYLVETRIAGKKVGNNAIIVK
jgi:hypothetical protein